jgi:succinoglycan biosynthesis protein ExoM
VRSRVFERLDGWFDPRLGMVGGEDSLFFRRARLAVCLIVWAGRAEVTEWIPLHRAMAGWLLRRSFRGGNAATLGRILTDDRLATRVSSALVSTARLLLALVRLPLAPWRGHHVTVRRLRAICYRLGSLAAVCG